MLEKRWTKHEKHEKHIHLLVNQSQGYTHHTGSAGTGPPSPFCWTSATGKRVQSGHTVKNACLMGLMYWGRGKNKEKPDGLHNCIHTADLTCAMRQVRWIQKLASETDATESHEFQQPEATRDVIESDIIHESEMAGAAHAPPKSLRLFSTTFACRIVGLILTMFKYVCREASSWVRGCFFLCRANGSFVSDFTDLSNVTFLTFRKARHMEFAFDFTSFHCMHCMLARHKRVKIMLGCAINKVDWPSWSDSKKDWPIAGPNFGNHFGLSCFPSRALGGHTGPPLLNLVCYNCLHCLPLLQEICLHYYDLHTYMYSFLLSLPSQISWIRP